MKHFEVELQVKVKQKNTLFCQNFGSEIEVKGEFFMI